MSASSAASDPMAANRKDHWPGRTGYHGKRLPAYLQLQGDGDCGGAKGQIVVGPGPQPSSAGLGPPLSSHTRMGGVVVDGMPRSADAAHDRSRRQLEFAMATPTPGSLPETYQPRPRPQPPPGGYGGGGGWRYGRS